LTVRLLYGEAFRAPKPWDFSDGIGNPDLRPEEMESIELGSSYDFSPNLRLSLAAYSNSLRGELTREDLGDTWRWVNRGQLSTDGVEASLELSHGGVASFLNYTYTFSADEDGVRVPEIAKHTANLGVRFALTDRLKLSLRGSYMGRRRNPTPIESTGSDWVEDAFISHATLSWESRRHWGLQLMVKNLFDSEYYHTSNRPPDRYRQPQRTVLVRLTRRFE
jgi:vitamin B12 transporter